MTGPAGYTRAVSISTTLTGLVAGDYTITAQPVTGTGSTFQVTPASFVRTVSAGSTASAPVSYSVGSAGPLNLILENAYITQAVQKYQGTVPLVAGRNALLRVFVLATAANTLQPSVRVRLYENTTLFQTYTIPAPQGSVPMAISEGTLSSTWNLPIPASDMRMNLRILVDVDPTNVITETQEGDNRWPRTGTATVDVRQVKPLALKFIPIHQSANGLTGNISVTNMETTFSMARSIFPFGQVSLSVRAPYTTNHPAVQLNDGNNAWLSILSEINALRGAEAAGETYYAGIIKTSYGSGIAGYAYAPGRASVSWDAASTVKRVFAHELGHNLGRSHVAACGSGNTDANYPHTGGSVFYWGWNPLTGGLLNPSSHTDVMGYCGTQWVSDYTWEKVFSWIQYVGGAQIASIVEPEPSLLVWGTIRDGKVYLEPSFRLPAGGEPPSGEGDYEVELKDSSGEVLLRTKFQPMALDHAENALGFSFTVPVTPFIEQRLSSVEVVSPSERAVQRASGQAVQSLQALYARAAKGDEIQAVVADDEVTLLAEPEAQVVQDGSEKRIFFNDGAYRMAMVRDAATGEILSFVRSSGQGFKYDGKDVEITFSDGIHSVSKRRGVE